MYRVFVAHTPVDGTFAALLKNQLIQAKLTPHLLGHGDWDAGLETILIQSALVVVVLSPEAHTDPIMTYCWAFALGKGITVLPVRLRDGDVHPHLANIKTVDFTHNNNWKDLITHIKETINLRETNRAHKTPPHVRGQVNPSEPRFREAIETVRLVSRLKTDSPAARQHAAHMLGKKRSSLAVEQLMPLLKDPDVAVRKATAQALGNIKDNQAVPELLHLLENDPAAPVRAAGARALWSIADPAAITGLRAALQDENAAVRQNAAHALGGIEDAESANLLLALLDDSAEGVRAAATSALGQIRAVAAIDELGACLKYDTSDPVRGAAAHALGKIGDPVAIPLLVQALDTKGPVSRAAAQALTQIGTPDALDQLDSWQQTQQSTTSS